ncbi:MAG: hypothetical protein ACSHXW_15760 [Yoonia sp.]
MLHEAEIPVPEELQKLMAMPACVDLSFPQVGELGISLPNGGKIKAISDLTNGIPTDCSLATNLLIQLQPFLASIECILKILGLLKPLIDVIKALPDPIAIAQAVPDFVEAAEELLPCFGMLIPGVPIYDFVKDILLLILAILKCVIGSLKTVLGVMQGIGLRIEAAEAAGNTQLKALLECAQENAANSASHAMSQMGPVENLMPMITSFLEMAGVELVLPELGAPEDAEKLEVIIGQLEDTVTMIEQIIESLP